MPGDSLDGILPLIGARAEPAPAPLFGPVVEGGPVLRPFVGRLVISYVAEEGSGRVFRHGDLILAGVDEPTLHRRALENLARHVKKVGIRLRPFGSMMAVLFDGDLEATLMLYATLWAHLREEMGDDLVVAAPARDVLAISPTDSPQGIAELKAVVQRVWPKDDHPLTADLLQLSGERWGVWKSSSP
jgi:hypothetical protein